MNAAVLDLTQLTVSDIMQHQVTTVAADMPLSAVARRLWDAQIGGAPVVDDADHLVGFVSTSDIVRFKAYGNPAVRGRGARARDVMTPATIHVRATTTVPELAAFLVNAGIHRALVLDHGRLVGIVSTLDIVQAVAQHARPAAGAQAGAGLHAAQ